LAFEGSRAELNATLVHMSTIVVETPEDQLELAERYLQGAPFIESVEREGARLRLKVTDDCQDISMIPNFLHDKGCRLLRFEQDNPTLEDAFMYLTQGRLQ
jgi:hypothetical protein